MKASEYLSNGSLFKRTYGTPTAASPFGLYREFWSDADTGRLSQMLTTKRQYNPATPTTPTSTTLESTGYLYDKNGNITSTITSAGEAARLQNQCFGYDGRNRLASANTIAHTATCTAPFNATAGPAPYNERSLGFPYSQYFKLRRGGSV